MAQVLLSVYCKHFEESKRGWGRDSKEKEKNNHFINLKQ